MRLIDADALSKDLEKRWNVNDDQDFCNKEVWYALEEAPTIEPSGDLISRESAIDAFGLSEKTRKYGGDHSGYNTMMLYEIQDVLESLPSADRPTGECRTCGRNADNGGVHEDGRTKCPIQEHYALLLDGYCHLYEPYDCGAKMGGDTE